MSSFESQTSPVQLNTVADDIYETEPFPRQGFANAGLEMVKVINGRPGIKVRSLLGEDTTQQEG
jgi:hypothetical protein